MSARVFMLVYLADPAIEPMTRATVARALATLPVDARLTVAFNGGATFALEAHPQLDVTAWNERLSLGVAYNRLVSASNEGFVVLLHNDCFVADGWLADLCAVATDGGFAFPVVENGDAEARGVKSVNPLMPPSCCYVVRRDAWDALGGFDESYEGCHFEDLDLFLRAMRARYRLGRVDSVKVFHHRAVTRAFVADEANAAYRKNSDRYFEKWGRGDQSLVPLLAITGGEYGRCGYLPHSVS